MTRTAHKTWQKPKPLLPSLSPREARAGIKVRAGSLAYPMDNRAIELLAMLRTMRPANSITERDFVEQWVAPLGTEPDGYGNHWLTIGDSPILWSCHTDTVHRHPGVQYVGFQDGCAYVTRSNCLGADDTVGVWIMRNMILAGVPGTYVFHRAEEVGGVGSGWVVDNTPERLAGIDFAIAFDRKGYHDVIIDQMGKTASETFAWSMAKALEPLAYEPADGIFTDTQVYSGLVCECSNISVGYHGQHTSGEWQDVDYALRLLDTLIAADFTGLVAHRDPAATSVYDWSWDRGRDGGWTITNDDLDRLLERDCPPPSMDTFCRENPDVASDFITSLGYTVGDLTKYCGM